MTSYTDKGIPVVHFKTKRAARDVYVNIDEATIESHSANKASQYLPVQDAWYFLAGPYLLTQSRTKKFKG